MLEWYKELERYDRVSQYSPAVEWFDTLPDDEELRVSGYVVMELIQGCRNKGELDRVRGELAPCAVVWLSPTDCEQALETFAEHRLSHNAGLLDVLVGQTAVALGVPLHTFNQRHYSFIPNMQTVQPYAKSE